MKIILELKDEEYPLEFIDHQRHIARGVVINELGEVALNKIYNLDKFGQRDYYELPGGGINEGETPEEAFKREILEEVGYTTEIIYPFGIVHDYYNLIHRENYNYYFLAKALVNQGQHLEEKETHYIEKLVWVPLEEAIQYFLNMKDDRISGLVKRRELPILVLAKQYLDSELKK